MSYVRTVQNDWNEIKKSDSYVVSVITDLKNSDNRHLINMADNPGEKPNNVPLENSKAENGVPTGSTTEYDPKDNTDAGGEMQSMD